MKLVNLFSDFNINNFSYFYVEKILSKYLNKLIKIRYWFNWLRGLNLEIFGIYMRLRQYEFEKRYLELLSPKVWW